MKTVVSKKKIHYSCEGRIENLVPMDPSFVITRQAS